MPTGWTAEDYARLGMTPPGAPQPQPQMPQMPQQPVPQQLSPEVVDEMRRRQALAQALGGGVGGLRR